MHDFLRSVGLRSLHTKEELRDLVNWVLEAPDDMSITDAGYDENLAEATRYFTDEAGVTVIGSITERGDVMPEYYFPCLKSQMISSEDIANVDRYQTRDGFVGVSDDYRVGTPLIFNVRNVIDAVRDFRENEEETAFRKVALSLLVSDGTVILPLAEDAKMTDEKREAFEKQREEAMREAENSPDAFREYAKNTIDEYERFLQYLENSDILSMVDSFFMPHGMESEIYYFLGTIVSVQDYFNELTGERFYQMEMEINSIRFLTAVNEADLEGVPAAGYRLRGHGWLQGTVS